jgi:hypothetical protein
MIGTDMTEKTLNARDFDTWQSERKLDGVLSPARHALAAWALAASIALTAVLGPPATRQAVAGLVELRHEVLMLDRELERVALRLQRPDHGAFVVSPTVAAASR